MSSLSFLRTPDEFQLFEKMGEGSYGSVHKARHRTTGQIVAAKIFDLSQAPKKQLDEIKHEISFLRACHHPNIVRYYGSYINPERLWVSRCLFFYHFSFRTFSICFSASPTLTHNSNPHSLTLIHSYLHSHSLTLFPFFS
jgi:serine/threonine protein kinase